jgi:hypothetical protein
MDISVPIVGFIFVCIIFPKIVKHKAQFYMAFAVLLVILALDILAAMIGVTTTSGVVVGLTGLGRVLMVIRGVLFIVDLILLVLATGGLSLHELGGELRGAYEVMRRGETEKTVIIPRTSQAPKTPDELEVERLAAAAEARAAAAKKAAEQPQADRTIPLE